MRQLDTATLDQAAIDYAGMFFMPDAKTPSGRAWWTGPNKVIQDFRLFTFKDEFEYVVDHFRQQLGSDARLRFDKLATKHFTPRDDGVLEKMLQERLAVDLNGDHIEGLVGKVELGRRIVARRPMLRRRPIVRPKRPGDLAGEWEIIGYREYAVATREEWPIYAGEGEERAAGRIRDYVGADAPGADPLPETAEPLPLGANVSNFSAEATIAALDAIAGRLDEGTTAAEIRGRTGSQPADPDAVETGTLLFTLPCSATAVAAAADDGDGTCSATFNTITDDSSADATGTLGYCRFAATGTGADDHVDGNATTDGTGATDWNTLSIVSGAVVSMTSAVLGMSQGSTAT